MYSAAVLDHFEHPRNGGNLIDAQVTIEVANPVCGDVLELSAIAADGRITAARFHARGCVTAMACASLLTEVIIGKTRAELLKLSPEQISTELDGLPPATFHGAQLAIDALTELLGKLKF
jgi:nitrogen fixation NifU-like protein